MTANDDFFDAQIRRAIFLERYKGATSRRMQRLLRETEADLETQLRRNLDSFNHERGRERSKRMVALLAFLKANRTETFQDFRRVLASELGELSVQEGQFQIKAAQQTIPVQVDFVTPPPAKLRAILRTREMLGANFSELVSTMAASDLDRMVRGLRAGVAQGDSTPALIQRVLGDGGTTSVTLDQADAVVRTITNAVANAARDEVWAANADLIAGLRWTATLDGRTSAICRARDGRVFPVNKGPRPPAHYRCRSVMVAVFDPEALVRTDRPFVRDTRTRKMRERDFRADARGKIGPARWKQLSRQERNSLIRQERNAWARENVGVEPEAPSYGPWLRRQPAAFQDEVLGPSRGRLFRQGKLEVSKFVDLSTGEEFTLDELRRREPDAWRAAGL